MIKIFILSILVTFSLAKDSSVEGCQDILKGDNTLKAAMVVGYILSANHSMSIYDGAKGVKDNCFKSLASGKTPVNYMQIKVRSFIKEKCSK